MKRCLDLLGSLVLLVLLSPLLFFIALLILWDDGLPVIYRRRVIGPQGLFDAFKFRTMRRDAEVALQQDRALLAEFTRNFKLRNDPRVLPSGAFLRKHSLDELPQLANVLLGQMSLVGPRMITAAELEKYGSQQQLLLSVRPGLTGYWQVNGRQCVAYQDRVRMDIFYIENWSLWLDFKILLKTPLSVLRKTGAY
jgi:lipopolysaccharide/colanic/teichoic acid biosynthesis glycosyltransferase